MPKPQYNHKKCARAMLPTQLAKLTTDDLIVIEQCGGKVHTHRTHNGTLKLYISNLEDIGSFAHASQHLRDLLSFHIARGDRTILIF